MNKMELLREKILYGNLIPAPVWAEGKWIKYDPPTDDAAKGIVPPDAIDRRVKVILEGGDNGGDEDIKSGEVRHADGWDWHIYAHRPRSEQSHSIAYYMIVEDE